jgi:hypothetical protein
MMTTSVMKDMAGEAGDDGVFGEMTRSSQFLKEERRRGRSLPVQYE